MDAAAKIGRNPVSTRFSLLGVEMSRLMRDGTAEPVSRDQILRRERGQGKIFIFCSVSDDYEHDWQPYCPVDSYLAICGRSLLFLLYVMTTYHIHTYIHSSCVAAPPAYCLPPGQIVLVHT